MGSRLNMPLKECLFGDWELVGRWFTEKYSTFDKFGDKPMKECSELYYKELTDGIRNQSFDWVALSDAYLKRKLQRGQGSLMLISSGSYLEGIKVLEVQKISNGYGIFVGPDPRETHTPSGKPMSLIGFVHEYGSLDGRIPARPHYRPAWERVRNKCRNIWLAHFREYMSTK